jgi:DNA-binding NarL/FixJ family response regulator
MREGPFLATTVLLVDDHALVREGLRRLLQDYSDLAVVGEAREGREAVRLAEELRPEVVLMDLSLPGMDGLETTKRIVAAGLKTRVLMLTMHANEEYALRVLQAGAHGFIVKDDPSEEVVGAIRKVAAGGVYVSPLIAGRLPKRYARHVEQPAALETLSDRELQVLKRFAEGHTTGQIARDLHLSVKTVETYRARLLDKLGLQTTADLIRFALRHGVIEDLW